MIELNHQESLAKFNDKYRENTEMKVLKEKYVQYIKFLFGGSKYYVGRSLAEVHANIRITDE